ncbi:hypothetical protein K439DRAFT_1616200 [Ramaria rubella]|nr:hypothetical protein K439DRAFT_1616200 [Ramaria rubella]
MGRKGKHKRNISGLQNQPNLTPDKPQASRSPSPPIFQLTNVSVDEDNELWEPQVCHDSTKVLWEEESASEGGEGEEGDDMSWFGWGDDSDALHESLVTLAAAHGDDP